jgi:diaminopimelate decarboxylase
MVGWAGYVAGRRDIFLESAARYGTPQYLLDEEALGERCKKLASAFASRTKNFRAYYPYKTNSIPHLLKIVHRYGIGAEVSSLLELQLADRLGVKDVIFNGPGKTRDEIGYAVKSATIIIDCIEEVEEIGKAAQAAGVEPKLGVRLSLRASRAEWRRFGIPPDELPHLRELLKARNLSLNGIHFHLGTGYKTPKQYVNALQEVGNLLGDGAFKDSEIKFIDVGGGIGSEGSDQKGFLDYASGYLEKHSGIGLRRGSSIQPPKTIDSFAERICKAFDDEIRPHASGAELWTESGRWLVAPCIHSLAKVLAVKKSGAVLDGGIDVIPNAVHEHYPVVNLTRYSNETTDINLHGPLPMSNDRIATRLYGMKPQKGDIVCALNVGAYNVSWTRQFVKPLARVISLSKGALAEVRRAEDLEYRIGRETKP